jgi:hypothetical protein
MNPDRPLMSAQNTFTEADISILAFAWDRPDILAARGPLLFRRHVKDHVDCMSERTCRVRVCRSNTEIGGVAPGSFHCRPSNICPSPSEAKMRKRRQRRSACGCIHVKDQNCSESIDE